MPETAAIPFIVAGAAAGGFINGLAGFGTAMFALGFWLQVMQPVEAVSISVFMSALTGLQGVWVVRRAIAANRLRLARFVLPGLLGIPPGIYALHWIEPHTLKLVIALFLIAYGAFFLARRSLPKFDRPTPLGDMGVGLTGGFLGGLSGVSGALPAMWCALRPWPRAETRAVLQPFNVAVLSVSALMLALRGAYTREVLTDFAIALPVSLISAQIGIAVFKRIPDTAFRWLLIGLMLISGIGLMLRELL